MKASRLASVALSLALGACATTGDRGPGWRVVPIASLDGQRPDGGRLVGAGGPNPAWTLPLDEVVGHWVRFSADLSATVGRVDDRLELRITLTENGRWLGQSVPTICAPVATMRRCTTALWIPAGVTRALAVVYASRRPVDLFAPRIEVATTVGHGPSPRARSDAVMTMLRERYYRTDEVDWVAMERAVAAIPAPPDDLDPVPAIVQFVRDRLPGNKHLTLFPRSASSAPASASAMPTCSSAQAFGVATLTDLSQSTGDAPDLYARTLHDCVMRGDASRPWVVDLRGNGGGNMYPMIAGLAPLLPVGPLYAFADRHRVATGRVALSRDGVTVDDALAMAAADASTRSGPVVVLVGPRCVSSCEQVANALMARPRTLVVGEATGGYLTANQVEPIDATYSLALTTAFTQDPCGRVIEDHIEPDVVVAQVDAKTVADVLAVDAVSRWVVDQRARVGTPVGAGERGARCAK